MEPTTMTLSMTLPLPQSQSQTLRPLMARCQAVALGGLLALCAAWANSASAWAQSAPLPLQSIASLDVPRYMGKWHEVAKYPNWFQRQCASATQATYSLQANGRVQVINQCKNDKGEWVGVQGEARQIGGADSAQLKVRFAPEWLSFIPLVWGDYWVIELDPDHQWALVSEPRREYLWVLSRTPQLPAETYQALLRKLAGLGFDLKKIEISRP